jgi:hypothetical protein
MLIITSFTFLPKTLVILDIQLTVNLLTLHYLQIQGTVSRDFRLPVFLMNQFHPSPRLSMRTDSNFFENSRRYSQLKVHHRCR